MVIEWVVEYDNDTGPDDEGFSEWWEVSNGAMSFKAYTKYSAEWLCKTLNKKGEKHDET